MKCEICGKEIERRKFHLHLKKEHNGIKVKDYYISYKYYFADKSKK